ncbi:MAG: hypothetical protein ING75_15800 [Rhodocyclaceae bacterium]|nr:hypothetical protein [Rhodocyclaceae bacterium]
MRGRRRTRSKVSTSLGFDAGQAARHQTIAQAAARLVAEGLTDYRLAKLKAAHSLGYAGLNALPDNAEIEAALCQYNNLFASKTQPVALRALRGAALRAMQWLKHFSPWISGPVLTGTANEFSAIELDLIGIDAKVFEFFLLNEDVMFEIHGGSTTGMGAGDVRGEGKDRRDRPIPPPIRYDIVFDDAPVEITLFDSHMQRLSAFPKSSSRYDRAQLTEAQQRFTGGSAT